MVATFIRFFAIMILTSSCAAQTGRVVDTLDILQISRVPEIDEDPACRGWKLSNDNILKAFVHMREASSVEWGTFCYVYPCSYKGEAMYRGRRYDIEINAGAFVKLIDKNSGGALYFIQENHTPWFLDACDCCESNNHKKNGNSLILFPPQDTPPC